MSNMHPVFTQIQYLDVGKGMFINLHSISHMQDFPTNDVLKIFTFGSPVDQFGCQLGIELHGDQRKRMLKFVSSIDINEEEQVAIEKEAGIQDSKDPSINS